MKWTMRPASCWRRTRRASATADGFRADRTAGPPPVRRPATRANYIGPRGRNIRPAARASARLGNLRYSLAAAAYVDPPESDSNHDDHEHPEHHGTSFGLIASSQSRCLRAATVGRGANLLHAPGLRRYAGTRRGRDSRKCRSRSTGSAICLTQLSIRALDSPFILSLKSHNHEEHEY